MTDTTPQFPTYEYTFKVITINYETAHFLVEYTPTDTKYTKITYNLPILPTFDINDVAAYVEKFAPHDKWYAQDIILQHGDALLGINQ